MQFQSENIIWNKTIYLNLKNQKTWYDFPTLLARFVQKRSWYEWKNKNTDMSVCMTIYMYVVLDFMKSIINFLEEYSSKQLKNLIL